ncbi:MAG: nucleotidyltransferase domain-containing protein [Acidimicrobiales bacterium]
MTRKPDPVQTARRFVDRHHPQAAAAFLGGSVMRGQGTETSDLDMVILTTAPPAPYRETLSFDRWTVETFVHSIETLRVWAAIDIAGRKPVLAQLATEGVIIADRGPADEVRSEMQALLDEGPAPLSQAELEALRYGLGDLLDDLADSPAGLERLVISAAVVDQVIKMELETAGQWSGSMKWGVRRLRQLQPDLAEALTGAAAEAAVDPARLIALADRRLDRHGGRLTDGYRADGQQIMDRWLRSEGGR